MRKYGIYSLWIPQDLGWNRRHRLLQVHPSPSKSTIPPSIGSLQPVYSQSPLETWMGVRNRLIPDRTGWLPDLLLRPSLFGQLAHHMREVAGILR